MISVGRLPSQVETSKLYVGARALPSLSDNGAYLQHHEFFYELSCDTTSCTWRRMKQKLSKAVRNAVMMYLPPGFARENC